LLVEIIALHDRRMTLEEQFRETKGCRFGVRLGWTPFHTPHDLARFLLLVGVVLVLWTAVGHAVAEQMPSVRFPCKQKGLRPSLVRVGMRYLLLLASQAALTAGFIQQHLPSPALRRFAWLQAAEVTS
jgi:hypothetical protein